MDIIYEDNYHQIEKNHWWFSGRREFILKLLTNYNSDKTSKILEIGCSGGVLLDFLKLNNYKNTYGIDLSETAVLRTKELGFTNVFQMDASKLEFESDLFDVIIASDILEHIEKQTEALKEWHRILKPGGILIIFVPAYNFIWSHHDVINHHFRRYSLKQLKASLKATDFIQRKSSYWNSILLFPAIIQRLTIRTYDTSKKYNINTPPSIINKALIKIIRMENRLHAKYTVPFGLSVYSVCTKKQS